MLASIGQIPESDVVVFTSATLPAVPDMLIAPIASGVGNTAPPPAPAASWIRKYSPGCNVTAGNGVALFQVPPADDAYCTDQPARSCAFEPALKSSMKSLCSGAPELPPPP